MLVIPRFALLIQAAGCCTRRLRSSKLETESYNAVMKWAVYAPAMVHPLPDFALSVDARHGVRILFGRLCSCCCTKSGDDVEAASGEKKILKLRFSC